MSYNIWPQLAGKGWNIAKRMSFNNVIHKTSVGAEFGTSLMQYPLYEFDLTVPFLSFADWSTLFGFFGQQGGDFLPFYFIHDNDSAEVATPFGTGNGSTTAFQIVKADSAFSEPVAALVSAPTIYANGVQILAAGTGAPAAPTLNQSVAGSKAARTYYARITYVDAAGNESASSSEASLAVLINEVLTVASPSAVQGAVSWNLYLNTVTNTEKYQVNTPIGTGYTEPTSALSFAGAAYPVVDNTTYVASLTSGLVTFTHAVANTIVLTWSGSYYYIVKFKGNTLGLMQFMSNMFESKGLTLRTFR